MHFLALILITFLQVQAPGKIIVATGPDIDTVKMARWHDFNEPALRKGRRSFKLIPATGGQPLEITLSDEQATALLAGKVVQAKPNHSELVVRLSYAPPQGKRAW